MRLQFFVFFVFFAFGSFAQEYTVSSGYIKPESKYQVNSQKTNDTLPFFDDFSQKSKFSENFVDFDVNIETYAAISPPSIGVAMFDAVDLEGDFYANYYNSSMKADFLTSRSMNMEFPGDNTIYMSFYYQAKGLLDLPEENDSLVLQFYAPLLDTWTTVWSAHNAVAGQDFQQVMIHISDDKYLQNGFKFRFYNRVSITSGVYPSLVSNCDQWFVDYIYINKNRNENDIYPHDVAFQYPIDFKIDNYQSIPYQHYKDNIDKDIFNQNYTIRYRNNDNVGRDIDKLYTVFEQKQNLLADDTLYLGAYSFDSNNDYEEGNSNINYSYPIIDYDELNYTLKTVLETNDADSTCNNVITQHKEMSTVYAYDDGTSENGYGLLGTGTLYAYVAQKYYTYSDDYITGMQVYFNKTFKDQQPFYFYAVVWEDNDTTHLPEEIVYEQSGFEINHDNLNSYQIFTFDEPVLVTDTFYIGWQKTTEDMMNAGIDLNYEGDNNKYYNIYGDWKKSSVGGVLMMRPIFGNTNLAKIDEVEPQISIYPNPTSSYVNVELSEYSSENSELSLIDFSGKTIYRSNFSGDRTTIDMTNYPPGVYFVKIQTENKIFTEKIIRQ